MLPGLSYGGYVQLKEIVEKTLVKKGGIIFEYRDNVVFANGKVIQGLKVIAPSVLLKGTHYTSWENATQIRSTGRINPSLNDPFVYISEPGKMTGWPEELIKKELGALSANTEVRLSIIAQIDEVWIKASRDVVHFAVPGPIVEEQITTLTIHKRKSLE